DQHLSNRLNVPSASLLSLRASAMNASTGLRASRIDLYGEDSSYRKMFPEFPNPAQGESVIPTVILNEPLAKELGAKAGDELVFSLEKPGAIHPEMLLGERDPAKTMRKLRLVVSQILPVRGAGRFSLRSNQSIPLLAYVELAELQRAIGQPARINEILAA